MTYPNNPYPPQQPGEGFPPQPAYGYPQQDAPPPGYNATPPGYGAPPPGYGYPQQQPAQPGYTYPQQGYAPGGYSPYGNSYGQPPLPFAHWGARVGAYLLDALIFFLPGFILEIIGMTVGTDSLDCSTYSSNSSSSYEYSSGCTGGSLNTVGLICVFLALALFIAAGIFLVYLEGSSGQTPGKKALKIRVVRESNGQPLGFGLALGRKLLHVVDSMACYLGWLWPLWDEKRQTLADKIVHTVVVKV
ncbi:RDD family protein [Nocardia sp. NPDC006630]|uniref:RDD family protein n=1 Tax=Nocardia sp. NPDC006630 TaxID=3157181 RepID=UPI0033B3B024